MSPLPLVKRGLFAVHDTGAPQKGDYTTLVMLHGVMWHSETFNRLVPLVQKYGCRLVLVNRRDYPGSTPYSTEELTLLRSPPHTTPEVVNEATRAFCKGRGKDIYDFLEEFIVSERIPKEGGIILSGWSLGAIFALAFLAYAPTAPVGRVDLSFYMRCVVSYDSAAHILGYPIPPTWSPATEPSIPLGEAMKTHFPRWVSSYYQHGETVSELEERIPLPGSVASFDNMTEDDIQATVYHPPGLPGGSDILIKDVLLESDSGIPTELRKDALFPSTHSTAAWDSVKFKLVWCDHSVPMPVYAAMCLRAECDEAEKAGKRMRPVEMARVRGANHFAHWDRPEQLLPVLLGVAE